MISWRRIAKMSCENEKALDCGPLERMFTGSAMAKILDFLDTFQEWDYNKTDISKNSGVNIRTILRLLPTLEDYGIIVNTRNVGKSQMYKFNAESPIAKAVHTLITQISIFDAQKIVQSEQVKTKAAQKASSKPLTVIS